MMRSLSFVGATGLASFVALAFACGGKPAGDASQASTMNDGGDGVIRPITNGQLTVAHFATPDGTVGLVLDRTGGLYKYQLDGSKDIVELTPLEDRHFGDRAGFFLQSPDGRNRLYLSVGGSLSIFTDRDRLPLSSDKDAAALGPATVTGKPVHTPSLSEVYTTKMTAIAVRTKFPEFTSIDSSNLDKVQAALAKADPSMAVHYAGQAKDAWFPAMEYTPGNQGGVGFGGGSWTSDDAWDPTSTKPGLGKYGGTVKGYSEYESLGNHLFTQTLKGYPPVLATGTPGVIWEADGPNAIFVTFDGGRYRVDTSSDTVKAGEPLVMGAGPAASWPKPLQQTLLGITEVTALVKAGAMPQANTDAVIGDDDDWNACAMKDWKKAKPQVDALATANIDGSAREARLGKLMDTWREKVRKDCKAPTAKLVTDLTKIIEARNAARMQIFTAAKAKFGT